MLLMKKQMRETAVNPDKMNELLSFSCYPCDMELPGCYSLGILTLLNPY